MLCWKELLVKILMEIWKIRSPDQQSHASKMIIWDQSRKKRLFLLLLMGCCKKLKWMLKLLWMKRLILTLHHLPQFQSKVPVNEFDTPGLAAMVFPDLFLGLPGRFNCPLAQADPTSQNRNFKVSERDGFKHLQWLSEIHPVTKLPYYPFADHIYFKYWCVDRNRRFTAIQQANVYFSKNPLEASKTPAELKEMLENAPNDAESMLGGLKENIVGSEAYWGAQAPVLEAACAQIAVPTVFGTLSFADGRNEDLQQILPGPIDPDQSKWAAKTRKFQQIVDFWFAKRSESFMKRFFKESLESRWIWSRYEW
ncbi:hypothetical protein BDR26DRAFT_668905 [Obelidium mucronatum]|nr:hypothetical protein BDR26DRAFT_668905 [Obelidium mucronatum]